MGYEIIVLFISRKCFGLGLDLDVCYSFFSSISSKHRMIEFDIKDINHKISNIGIMDSGFFEGTLTFAPYRFETGKKLANRKTREIVPFHRGTSKKK